MALNQRHSIFDSNRCCVLACGLALQWDLEVVGRLRFKDVQENGGSFDLDWKRRLEICSNRSDFIGFTVFFVYLRACYVNKG